MRIGQEAHVEDVVDVERHPVLEAKRHDRDLHALGAVRRKQVDEPLAELIDIEIGRVHDHVGHGPDRLQPFPLENDGLDNPLLAERVPPPGALEAAHQDLVGRLQEQRANLRPAGLQLVDGGLQLFELVNVAADDQGHPMGRRAGGADELGHLGDQGGGQVVDHEPAQVLQCCARLRPARARHPRDDQELGHATILPPSRGRTRAS